MADPIKQEENQDNNMTKKEEGKISEQADKNQPEIKGNALNSEPKEETFEELKIPELKPGMTIRVFQKIKELNVKGEEKERVQYFEGIIIAKKHGNEAGGTITVRKISEGVGVEKIFPLNLPTITKIEVKKQAKVNRAKLFFLRRGYKKKLKEVLKK